MHKVDSVRILDIESINNCNADCPLCVRYPGMSTNDRLDWQRAFSNCPDVFWQSLTKINLNGTTGDNIMHPEIKDMISWLCKNTTADLRLSTNGSIRSTEWWEDFADLPRPITVIFGIDGLSGTHEIYRRRTNWQKIIDNATSFIKSGGNAEWQFIVFDHNHTEIEECRKIADRLGFSRFFTIYQDRFSEEEIEGIRPYSGDKNHIDVVRQDQKNWSASKVNCRSKQIDWLSLYADATVWPCCWIMGWHRIDRKDLHIQLIKKHMKQILQIDLKEISLYNNTLSDILSSDLWQHRWLDSFESNPNPICRKQCSIYAT